MAIFSAIGGLIATALFGGSALAASIIGTGLAVGAQLALSYIRRPKKRSYSAVQGSVQFGADVPAGTVYGTSKVKGHRAYYAKWGSGNKGNADVFILANGWCDGLEPYVYFYGEKHNLIARPITGNEVACYGVENYQNDGYDRIVIRFYDGRPGQDVDQQLVNLTANTGNPWKTTSVMAGLVYVVVERTFTSDLFSRGRPDIEFVLRGLREYDPRFDSTVPGGSGPQRLNDPATWVHTNNPSIHRLNYLLGVKGPASGRTLIGLGYVPAQIDYSSHMASATVCDTVRNGKPTYAASLYVQADDDHLEVLAEFEDAMAGYAVNRSGLSGVIAGAPQIPVLEITAADIRTDEGQEVQYRRSAFDTFNTLSGQFTSIESHWKPESLKTVFVNADIAADGRRRQNANDFLQVTDPDIAQYLLNIRYRQNRKAGKASLPVSRRVGAKVEPGDWVTFAGKQWLVTRKGFDARVRFRLDLAETGADIYDDGEIEPGPIIVPPVAPQNPSLLSTVQNFNVTVGLIEGGNGHQVPALQFTWTPPDDPSIIEVRFEYFIGTEYTGQPIYEAKTDRPESGIFRTAKDIQPYAVYTARATIRTVPDRFKTYTAWVTTATATGAFEVYPPGLIAELQDFIGEGEQWVRSGVRDLLESARKLSVEDVNAQFADYFARQQIRREVNVAYDRVTAEYSEVITVQIAEVNGSITAVSQRLEELSVTFDSNLASAVDLLQVQISDVSGDVVAVANSLTLLEAEVDGVVSSITVRGEAQASPGGGWARYGVEVRVGTGPSWSTAGFFIDVNGSSSRVVFQTNQFIITDGTNLQNPFAFIGGVLYLTNAKIVQAQIDNLLVGTSNIQPGAVTDVAVQGPYSGSGTSITLSLTYNHGANAGLMVVTMSGQGRAADDGGQGSMLFRGTAAGSIRFSYTISVAAADGGPRWPCSQTFTHQPSAGTTSTTFVFEIGRSSGSINVSSANMYIVVEQLKR